MTKQVYQRKTYYVGTEDEQVTVNFQERHGLSTDNEAVRYASGRLDELERKPRH